MLPRQTLFSVKWLEVLRLAWDPRQVEGATGLAAQDHSALTVDPPWVTQQENENDA